MPQAAVRTRAPRRCLGHLATDEREFADQRHGVENKMKRAREGSQCSQLRFCRNKPARPVRFAALSRSGRDRREIVRRQAVEIWTVSMSLSLARFVSCAASAGARRRTILSPNASVTRVLKV
jgi:hypothetical protein